MIALLALGFLVGVRHALEADHVAAVASLATRSASLRDKIKVAMAWGGGHAASLGLIGSILIALGASLPERAARGFEVAAGAMLIVLGADVLRRVRRRGIHFHVHEHDDGRRHLHGHAHHRAPARGASDEHRHDHTHGMVPRAVLVGGIHGLAGSGALVVLSMQMVGSGARAIAYVLLFALGSILGMVGFSLALSLPLAFSARLLERTAGRLEALLGIATIAVGGWMAVQAAAF